MAETVVTSPYGDITVQHPDGASEDDIINYAKQNYSPQASAPSSTAYDIAASGAAGIGKGAAGLLGLPADAANAFGYYRDKYVTNPIVKAMGGTPQTEDQLSTNPLAPYGSANIQKQIENVTGEFHKPETTAGKYAESVGEFLPGAVAAPGGIVSNAIRYGVMPGLASEAAGQATQGTSYEPYARAAGAIAGGMINPARAVTPLPASEARNAMVNTLNNEGVTSLTAGQKTGSEPLRYLESASSAAPMGGGGASRIQAEGQHQFTEAALDRAGTGPVATPEVLSQNYQRLGKQFNDLAARNSIIPDPQLITDLTSAVKDYQRVPPSQQRSIVENYIDDISKHVQSGSLPGPEYQEMRSRLSRQSNSLRNSDPTLSGALGDIRDSLDGAMSRSISPQDKDLWQQTRQEYGAQKVLEKSASRAGEATAEGQITPANLRNTIAGENRGAYARGQGPFNELARAGVGVMSPLPNSGTAQRMNAFNILGIVNGLTGGALPAITGHALMSKPVQSYMSNQLMHGSFPNSPAAQKLLLIEALQRGQQPAIQSQ